VERLNTWQGLGSLMVMGSVDVPGQGFKLGPKHHSPSTLGGGGGAAGRFAMTSGKKVDDHHHPNQKIEIEKIIVHPGEINCLKCWSKNKRIIATHSDNRHVYVWDMNSQKNA
jgi:hypothetical protein